MHRLVFFALCVSYFLFSFTIAQSFTISVTTPSKHLNAVLVADSKSSDSSSSDTDSDSKHSTTSHTGSPPTHRPHSPTHTEHWSFTHPWTPPSSTSAPSTTPPVSHHLGPTGIAGIVIGTLVAFGLVLSFIRCWWHWKKTPGRDRIATLMHRYQLEREMGEAAAEPLRARVRRPPPPPYRPPPPGYETVMPSSPLPVHTEMRTSPLNEV